MEQIIRGYSLVKGWTRNHREYNIKTSILLSLSVGIKPPHVVIIVIFITVTEIVIVVYAHGQTANLAILTDPEKTVRTNAVVFDMGFHVTLQVISSTIRLLTHATYERAYAFVKLLDVSAEAVKLGKGPTTHSAIV